MDDSNTLSSTLCVPIPSLEAVATDPCFRRVSFLDDASYLSLVAVILQKFNSIKIAENSHPVLVCKARQVYGEDVYIPE